MHSDIAVGFDFDHTLGIDNRLEREVALSMLADLAAKNKLTYSVAAAEVAIDEVLHSYRESDRSIDSFIAGFFERFAPAGQAVMDAANGFRDAVVSSAPSHVEPLPGARELLAELGAMGIPYALLTNGWSPLQEEKARLLGFAGPVFVSERIGARKPSAQAFGMLAKHFELPFERIWYVGDDPVLDCAGARAVGMTAIWLDRDGRPYPPDILPPDHVVHALEEIPPLLRAARGA